MKNFFKALFFIAFFFCVLTGYAQQKKFKLGHIDSNELLGMMPGRDTAQAKLQVYVNSLGQQLRNMQAELETKQNEYYENEKQWSELIKNTKYKELVDLSNRIEAFQTSAQDDLQKKEQELLQPIIDIAKKAIEQVAEENGFTYILDTGYGMVLFFDASDDILPLVKKKLNIK